MLPKISIIIAVYNGVKTIGRAIESVLHQQYPNIELIIVDGKSNDGTVAILEAVQSPFLFWKSEPDAGVYDAMNKGITRATGDWIYFLGSDDFLFDNLVLQKIFGGNEHLSADIIYGNVWTENKKYDGPFDQEKLLYRNICHQSIFYKRALHEFKGNYNPHYKIFADWDFNLRCFFDDRIQIKYVDVIVAHFEVGGISSGKDDYEFFRHSLFVHSLIKLERDGIESLKNIQRYDRWWRLLRSMQVPGRKGLIHYVQPHHLPDAIIAMYHAQQRIPSKWIYIGFISKSAMALSYMGSRFFKKALR